MSEAAALRNGEANGRAKPFGLFERSIALRYLMAKRAHGGVALIAILSFLGIMLAVAVLIVVMSVMNGFRHDLLTRLLGAQGHIFVRAEYSDPVTTQAMAERLAAMPGVLRAAPVISGQGGVMANDAFSGVLIYGLGHDDIESLTIVRDNILAGSIDTFGRDEGERGILVGSQLANRLGLVIGSPVSMLAPSSASTVLGQPGFRRATYYVDGIFSVGMSQVDDLFIYMPIDEARAFLSRPPTDIADYIEVSTAEPDDVQLLRRRIQQELAGEAVIEDWRDRYGSYVGALAVERNVMRLILAMLVLIAALNIISGLVMLAKNKSGDIAILRTIGATQGSIMRIFFMIGATVGVLGTAAGLTLGTLFCLNIGAIQEVMEAVLRVELFPDDIYFLSQIPARIEWSEVSFVALWGFAMACLTTLPPAWSASGLDPVEALRFG